jgi:hypothetical protein
MNDWLYGIDPDISHLVVWTKFRFENAAMRDLTDRPRELIKGIVRERFCVSGNARQDESRCTVCEESMSCFFHLAQSTLRREEE